MDLRFFVSNKLNNKKVKYIIKLYLAPQIKVQLKRKSKRLKEKIPCVCNPNEITTHLKNESNGNMKKFLLHKEEKRTEEK